MRKTIHLCRRRPDIDHPRYAELLLRGHVPIALDHHPAMRRYVVNLVEQAFVPPPEELDSVGELSFESMADYRERLYDSAEGERIVQADVAGFMAAAASYECTEIVQKGGPQAGPLVRRSPTASPGVKLLLCLKRKDGMTHQEFAEYWTRRHAPIVLEHGAHLSRYVQNVVDGRFSRAGEEYDGFAELHFATDDDFAKQFASHGQGPNPVQEDTANFVGGMAVLRLAEYVVKLP
jgi:uncharacterized protein (TIGR02118 family)